MKSGYFVFTKMLKSSIESLEWSGLPAGKCTNLPRYFRWGEKFCISTSALRLTPAAPSSTSQPEQSDTIALFGRHRIALFSVLGFLPWPQAEVRDTVGRIA